jgi:hypothetical protein
MIIWLASYPRSGNSLASLALRLLFGRETRTIYERSAVNNGQLQRLLGESISEREVQQLASASEPYFVKTHELPGRDEHPAIYLVRDGRDAIVSYAHFILDTQLGISSGSNRQAFLQVLDELVMTDDHFGGWSGNLLAWHHREAPTVTIRFEDLARDPTGVLAGAVSSLGYQELTPSGGTFPSFETLHATFPWFFRQGRAGTWRAEMPEIIHQLFWKRHREAMTAFDYRYESSEQPSAVVSAERYEKALDESLLLIQDLRERLVVFQTAASERLAHAGERTAHSSPQRRSRCAKSAIGNRSAVANKEPAVRAP